LGLSTWTNIKNWKDTPSLWNHALAVTTDNIRAHFLLGTYYWERGDLGRAERQFRAALEIQPASPAFIAGAHSNLGLILYHTGRTEEGDRHHKAALEIMPQDATVHLNLGLCLSLVKQFAPAEEQYRLALQTDPESVTILSALGKLLYSQGRLEEAKSKF